jgi:hypothetical protein
MLRRGRGLGSRRLGSLSLWRLSLRKPGLGRRGRRSRWRRHVRRGNARRQDRGLGLRLSMGGAWRHGLCLGGGLQRGRRRR